MIKEILETALLGTDRKACDFHVLPDEIGSRLTSSTDEVGVDKEAAFLDAITYESFYESMGKGLLKWEGQADIEAIHEEKPYCSREIVLLLKEIIENGDIDRENFLLKIFAIIDKREELLRPEVVLDVLNMYYHAGRECRLLMRKLIGKRGQFILPYMPEIKLPVEEELGTIWEESTPSQRRKMFEEMHFSEPARAIELLRPDWDKEGIRDKVYFAKTIARQFQMEDHVFVQEIYQEHFEDVVCSKVTERDCKRVFCGMMAELQHAPLWNAVKETLSPYLKERKAKQILGFAVGKTIREIHLPEEPDEIWNGENMSGLLGLSPSNSDPKTFENDALFWLNGMLRMMPFSEFWPPILRVDTAGCLKYFLKSKDFQSIIGGHKMAIFKDAILHNAMTKIDDNLVPALLGILNSQEALRLLDYADQELYEKYVIGGNLTQNYPFLSSRNAVDENQWSTRFAKRVLDDVFAAMGRDRFYIDRPSGKKNALFFPPEALGHLRKLSKKSESEVFYNKWASHVALPIERVVELRQKIKNLEDR